ncbi:MAG: hypothetical protein RLZZ444_436 [Pseudomonadota bacterium]|jgi:protein TonB
MVPLSSTMPSLISTVDRLAVLAIVATVHVAAIAGVVAITPTDLEPGLQQIDVISADALGLETPEMVRDVPTAIPIEAPKAVQPETKAVQDVPRTVEMPKALSGEDPLLKQVDPVEEAENKPETEPQADEAGSEPTEQAAQPSAEKPRPAVNREMLVQYAVLASAAINRMKFYPKDARSKRNTGIVEVAFVISASGSVAETRVTRSSGSKTLDAAALRMVATAELPPPPNGLFRGRITINFRIRK